MVFQKPPPKTPPAVLEPPAPLLPAIAFLRRDALQMGHEFVAQFVDGAAVPGVVGGEGRLGGVDRAARRVLFQVAEDAGEAGPRGGGGGGGPGWGGLLGGGGGARV